MEQLEGYVIPGQEHKVYKLINIFIWFETRTYWHEKIDCVMLSYGYVLN